MSYGTPYGAAAYAGVGLQTKVATASPHGLIVMLYDGALQALSNWPVPARAGQHFRQGEKPSPRQSTSSIRVSTPASIRWSAVKSRPV